MRHRGVNGFCTCDMQSLEPRVLFIADNATWLRPPPPWRAGYAGTNYSFSSRGTLTLTARDPAWSRASKWEMHIELYNDKKKGPCLMYWEEGYGNRKHPLSRIKRLTIRAGVGIPMDLVIDPQLKFNSSITGSFMNDTIVGGSRVDVIDGGAGNDRINAGDGNDSVTGGAGNDRINADDGYDLVDGGSGRDIITGGAGQDTLLGGGGNDHLDGGRATDLLRGGTGDDTFATIDTFGNRDLVFGERGIDQLAKLDPDDVFDPGSQIAG